MTPPIKLYLFPGSGTDWRLYAPQIEVFSNVIIPEWLPPLDLDESLESYVLRLRSRIDTSGPFILGGVSLGGMIAQEMALLVKPAAVLLIATCTSAKALSFWARLSGKLTRLLPDAFCRFQLKLLSWLVSRFLSDQVKYKALYVQMLKEMSPRLVRWQSGAAVKWSLRKELEVPVFHIHGVRDEIIPFRNVEPSDVIKGGGHVINATHDKEVNRFISRCIKAVAVKEYAPLITKVKHVIH
jgi:pimeloyl-ACP methyl ester carboxylesterase